MTYEKLYAAALEAVRAMGPDLKSVSWFKRNWRDAKLDSDDEGYTQIKKAA